MASAGESRVWGVETERRVYGLQVVMLKRVYVLPWSQFLYAEGTTEEVRAVFSTHDVMVKGNDLASLLSDFASQQITVLKEPARADKFTSAAGSRILELEVRRVETDGLE
jgi:hypothetical protein